MPLIVDEVVISVEVGAAAGGGALPRDARDDRALVAECVERVLEILRERQER